jgi:hypothetical protein
VRRRLLPPWSAPVIDDSDSCRSSSRIDPSSAWFNWWCMEGAALAGRGWCDSGIQDRVAWRRGFVGVRGAGLNWDARLDSGPHGLDLGRVGIGCCLSTDSSIVVVGQRMATWGHVRLHRIIKVAILGFILCEDGDLPDIDPSCSGESGQFRNAPSTNVNAHLMHGVCLIG